MKACPLEFQHPSQAQQLNGLGPKLCDRLTDKLKEYCAENGLPPPEAPNQRKSASPQPVDYGSKNRREQKTLRRRPARRWTGKKTT